MTLDTEELTQLWLKFKGDNPLSSNEEREIEEVIRGKDKIVLAQPLTIDPQTEICDTEIPKGNDSSVLPISNPEASVPAASALGTSAPVVGEKVSSDLRNQLDGMTIPQKIKLAMFGNKQCRSILISDRSRIVQQFVLKNPRLTITEIEAFARNPQMDDYILRAIADSREWIKDYSIKKTLVFNSRTPLDISLRWLKFLSMNDIKMLSRSKNLPQTLVVGAKRKLAESQE